MKKIFLFATLVALVMVAPIQAQSRQDKKAAKKAKWEMEQRQKAEEAELLHQQRMDSIKNAKVEKDAAAARQRDLDNLKYEADRRKKEKKYGLNDIQLFDTPCMDEFLALNKVRGQMAAQGISTGQPTQESAELNANKVALSDITSRFLGVLKNGVEHYSKDVSAERQRDIKTEIEGMATAFGEKAINELYVVDCRKFGTDRYNQWVCYEALYVPIDEVLDVVVNETAKRIDIDKNKFRKRMQEELDANAARENTSLQQQYNEHEDE